MGLSEAMLFAFAATIICAFAIAEKIIDIDFEQFMLKTRFLAFSCLVP